MNKKPLVTIVTITFNLIKSGRKDFFRQCVESVHNQNYENIEHIIIDGASTDGTLDLIKEYSDKNWIKYISEKDSGIYDAMNKGIKIAKGKYVAFLNSDDFYNDKNAVKESVEALEDNNADFSYASVVNLSKDGEEKIIKPNIKNVFYTIVPNHQTIFVKRDVLLKEKMFNKNLKCIADYDFTLRMCLKNYKSIFIDNAFTTYRLGGYSKEATTSGLVFEEMSNIFYNNYNKLCNITIKESEQICGNIYNSNCEAIPFKLAKILSKKTDYFDFEEYLIKRLHIQGRQLKQKNQQLQQKDDIILNIKNSKSFQLGSLFFRSVKKPYKLITFPINFLRILIK